MIFFRLFLYYTTKYGIIQITKRLQVIKIGQEVNFLHNNPPIYEKSISRIVFYQQYESPIHFHLNAELKFVLKGRIEANFGGETFTIGEGKGIIVFPYQPHGYRDIDSERVCIIQTAPDINTTYKEIFYRKRPENCVFDIDDMDDSLPELIHTMENFCEKEGQVDNPIVSEIKNGYTTAALGMVLSKLKLVDVQSGSDDDAVYRLINWCWEHYQEPITEKDAAKALFISERTVSRILAERFRTGFRQLINSFRINNAMRLLSTTSVPVSEIAYECGFGSICSFNRVFREFTGKTPREVREASR